MTFLLFLFSDGDPESKASLLFRVWVCVRLFASLSGGGRLESASLLFDLFRHKWKRTPLLSSKPETPAPWFFSGSWIIGCSLIYTGFKTSTKQQKHVTCDKHLFHQQNRGVAANLSLSRSTLAFWSLLVLCQLLITPIWRFRSETSQCIQIVPTIHIFQRLRKWNDWTRILQGGNY